MILPQLFNPQTPLPVLSPAVHQLQCNYKLKIRYMAFLYPTDWSQYFTATIHNWLPVLAPNKYKNIIVESLQYLTREKRIQLNAFVLMSNHIHLIWQPMAGDSLSSIQLSFMKFTAQQIKFNLIDDNSPLLLDCLVNKKDRQYQIWKRKPLSVELHSANVFMQKLKYIHNNPVNAGLCQYAEHYHFSSALFYEKGIDNFGMLTHFMG